MKGLMGAKKLVPSESNDQDHQKKPALPSLGASILRLLTQKQEIKESPNFDSHLLRYRTGMKTNHGCQYC